MTSKKRERSPTATKYHRDGSVTIWNVYEQQWWRTKRPSDRVLASLTPEENERVQKHCKIED